MNVKPENEFIGYVAMNVGIKTGNEPFQLNGQPLQATLLDFWRWSASDLVNNALRGQIAEYIVAQALGITTLRVVWDAFDLQTATGLRVEVKSAAYLQSWYHRKLSPISFSIRPTLAWDTATNTYGTEVKRQADIYVFCLLNHQDKATVDPLNLDQWEFYILTAARLNEACPKQKTIVLHRLKQLGAKKLTYNDLLVAITDRV